MSKNTEDVKFSYAEVVIAAQHAQIRALTESAKTYMCMHDAVLKAVSLDKAFLDAETIRQMNEAPAMLRSVINAAESHFKDDFFYNAAKAEAAKAKAEAEAENARLLGGIVGAVLAERERQKSIEGWTPEHDDQHDSCELAWAACYYAMPHPLRHKCHCGTSSFTTPDSLYAETGWDEQWAKRGSKAPERRIVVAMALLLAEAERFERKKAFEEKCATCAHNEADYPDDCETCQEDSSAPNYKPITGPEGGAA